MSFWRSFGFQTASPIDTILDKENFTLEELLEEEEVFQETKSQNKKLIDFLIKPHVLKKLISFVTESLDGYESKKKFRYPSASCEILSSEVWSLLEALFEDTKILHPLFAYLVEAKEPSANTAFVAKILGSFVAKKTAQTTKLLKDFDFAKLFVENIRQAGILELLLKVVGADDGTKDGIGQWLHDSQFIPSLIDKFEGSQQEIHENVAYVLEEIISQYKTQYRNAMLYKQLTSQQTLSKLFDYVLSGQSESQLLFGLGIINELLRKESKELLDSESKIETLSPLFTIISARIPNFITLLSKPVSQKTFAMTFGTIVPLGFTRLKILDFVGLLVKTNYACVHELLVKNQVITACTDLFFQYEWNNFLHSSVSQIIESIIRSPNRELKKALLTEVRLIDKIVDAVDKNNEGIKQPKGTRKGYMAFVTIISESLINESGKEEIILKFLDGHERWKNYVATSLTEARNADSKQLGKPLSIGGDSSDDDDTEQEEKNPAQLVFTQYLAQQNYSGIYPEEYNEEDEYDEEGESAFDEEDSFEPRGTFNIEEKAFELEPDESDSSEEEKNQDNFYNVEKDVNDLAEKIQPIQTNSKDEKLEISS